MKIWQIASSHPFPITIEAETDFVAALATVFMGDGIYSLVRSSIDKPSSDVRMPGFFEFDQMAAIDEWFDGNYYASFEYCITSKGSGVEAILKAIKSAMPGTIRDRLHLNKTLESMPEESREAWINTHNAEFSHGFPEVCEELWGLTEATFREQKQHSRADTHFKDPEMTVCRPKIA